jgi:hypothetical protein
LKSSIGSSVSIVTSLSMRATMRNSNYDGGGLLRKCFHVW